MSQSKEQRLYNWGIFLDDGNNINTMTITPLKAFGEVGHYTEQQIQELNRLAKTTPPPAWSSDQWEMHQQINEFSKQLRDKVTQKSQDK